MAHALVFPPTNLLHNTVVRSARRYPRFPFLAIGGQIVLAESENCQDKTSPSE